MATAARRLLTAAEAAVYLGYAPQTLQNWRSAGQGPRFVSRGRGLRYDVRDLDQWIEDNAHTSTR